MVRMTHSMASLPDRVDTNICTYTQTYVCFNACKYNTLPGKQLIKQQHTNAKTGEWPNSRLKGQQLILIFTQHN